KQAGCEARTNIAHKNSVGADGTGNLWHQDALYADLSGDGNGVKSCCGATGHHDIFAWIDTSAQRDILDSRDHVLLNRHADQACSLCFAHAEGLSDISANGGHRQGGVERHDPAGKSFGIEKAARQVGVGDGCLGAAPAIAGWGRPSTGTFWSHMDESARVDSGDATAPGTDSFHIDGRHAEHMAGDNAFAMHGDIPVGDNADVEARPAHVDDNDIALLDLFEPSEAPSR